jgi:hypothetical protein
MNRERLRVQLREALLQRLGPLHECTLMECEGRVGEGPA